MEYLSNKELGDIGVTRGEIDYLARTALSVDRGLIVTDCDYQGRHRSRICFRL